MLRAVLFDLDNTLILYDEMEFFKGYLPQITHSFADLIPPDIFPKKFISAMRTMMKNDGSKSNRDSFLNAISDGAEDRRDEIWSRFLAFHFTEYDQFKSLVSVPKGIHNVFQKLKKKDIKLVIASNPIWPLEIQEKRFLWTGVKDQNFDLITHIENMSYCKPSIEYYEEICEKINEMPEACLMVGNDLTNDMIASKIGMKTFLVIDGSEIDEQAAARRESRAAEMEVPAPDFKGRFTELTQIVDTLMM
jgi:FMN phosphatase YigB (HAD superfamily)